MYWLTVTYCGHSHPQQHWCMISSLVVECWQPWAHRFMEDGADAACPTEGTVEKKGLGLHSIWVILPVYAMAFVRCCFIRSFMSWVMQPAMRMVWSHISLALGRGCALESLVSLAPPSCWKNQNHTLPRLGCENKNENTSWRSGGNKLRREESCHLWHCVSAPRQFECGSFFNAKIFPNTMTWLCPLAEGGWGGGRGRDVVTLCAPVRHPESTQVCAALRHCQTDPLLHPPPPHCPLKWRGCSDF